MTDFYDLRGRTALVTGTSRGIGHALAKVLKESGATVIGLSSKHDTRNAGLDRHLRVDLLDPDASVPDLDRVDILVNNAGVFMDKPGRSENDVLLLTPEHLADTLNVNFLAAFRLCQMVLPFLLARGHGRILNVSSGMGRLSEFDGASFAYRVSKLSLNALTMALAKRCGGVPDVSVFACCPGWVRTDMGGPGAPVDSLDAARAMLDRLRLPAVETNGRFFRGKQVLAWHAKLQA